MSYPCPSCGLRGHVTRTQAGPGFVRRRLKCTNGHRFNTVERPLPDHARIPTEPEQEPTQAETPCN